jgi:hypothetical protein
VLESNQAYAHFGYSVATAGDLNRDGYSDIVIGAPDYDHDQAGEGAAFVYHGSSTGIGPFWARRLESVQASAWFGSSVATAGDVNGDGYSDLVVGAQFYDNGQTDEGRAFVYHGSASGVPALASWTAEPDQASAFFGASVATAGDVNGDGYSEVLVGSDRFDGGQTDEGRAFLYYGNAGDGLDRTRRMHRTSGEPARIFASIPAPEGFLVRVDGRMPFGRGEVRLEVERKTLDVPFDGTGLETTAYADTGAPGPAGSVVTLEELLSIPGSGKYRFRARLRALAPFPWQSHWMGIPDNAVTEIDFRAP